MIEAVDPIKILLTSMPNTYKVFENLHMLWDVYMDELEQIMVALLDQAFGSHLDFWVTLGQQMMLKCSD